MKPTIGIIQPHLNCCGGVRHMLELANGMTKMGYDVQMIVDASNYKKRVVPSFVSWIECLAPIISSDDAQKKEWDITIFTCAGLYDMSYNIKSKIKVYFVIGDEASYSTLGADRVNSSFTDEFVYIVNSSSLKDMIENKGHKVHSVLINGIDHSIFKPDTSVSKNYAVVYYGGTGNKRGDLIKEALSSIPHLTYHQIQTTNQSQLLNELNQGEIFIFASDSAGFANPVLEAMTCGIAVITTNAGVSDIAENGRNCIIIPKNDAKAIVDEVKILLADPGYRNSLIDFGKHTASKFQWIKSVEEFKNFIKEVWHEYEKI